MHLSRHLHLPRPSFEHSVSLSVIKCHLCKWNKIASILLPILTLLDLGVTTISNKNGTLQGS